MFDKQGLLYLIAMYVFFALVIFMRLYYVG